MLILKEIYRFYFQYLEESRDKRYDGYPLMGSPLKIIALLAVYLYFVQSYGRKFMSNRKPYQLNNVIAGYNLLQVSLNAYASISGTYHVIERKYDLRCMIVQPKDSEKAPLEAYFTYFYFLLKVLDLADTVFFVLRKKFNQITFLHVYHHTIMAFVSYFFAQYLPGGHMASVGLINGYVHVFMYFYYFLTIVRPKMKTSLWWKKHLTQIQILQFFLLSLHFLYPLLFMKCAYPTAALIFASMQNIFMFILFADFYIKTYIKKPKNDASLKEDTSKIPQKVN